MRTIARIAILFCCSMASVVYAQSPTPSNDTPDKSADEQAIAKIRALNWVKGPTTVSVADNSQLDIPKGYVFLDAADTAKWEELNHNLSGGGQVMVAPMSLDWVGYLRFSAEGYVKDDDKIDAPDLLKTIQTNTAQGNVERQRRGWAPFHIIDWAVPPAYNSQTKRLEWATLFESEGQRVVNFSTKILGRHGYTSVVMATDPENLAASEPALNNVLQGYKFNTGETYAEWQPGDKVAEYGLAALIVGGAAAVATKKGFWAILGGLMAAAWKVLAAAAVGALAWVKSLFSRKKA